MIRRLSIIFIAFAFTFKASLACDLTSHKASSLASNHFKENQDHYVEWFDENTVHLIYSKLSKKPLLDKEAQKYLFPLLTIKEKYLYGSLWIEVSCDGKVRSRHFFEEI